MSREGMYNKDVIFTIRMIFFSLQKWASITTGEMNETTGIPSDSCHEFNK